MPGPKSSRRFSHYSEEFDFSLTNPPVSPKQYAYFEDAQLHPFDETPSLRNAWWLSECALAAYCKPVDAKLAFNLAGMTISGGSPARGPANGGQCYVLFDDSKVVLSFRGTRVVIPADLQSIVGLQEKLADVKKDLQTDAAISLVPWSGRSGGRVHSGFRNSLDEMWPEVAARVQALREGRSLWLCGHSLGGALATLAADRLAGITGVFTFGSPAVGDADFASRWDVPGMRFRNFTDIVPWLPPSMLKYRHVKSGVYFNSAGELVPEPNDLRLMVDALLGAPEGIAESIRGLMRGQAMALAPIVLRDHAPLLYVLKAWRAYARQSEQSA